MHHNCMTLVKHYQTNFMFVLYWKNCLGLYLSLCFCQNRVFYFHVPKKIVYKMSWRNSVVIFFFPFFLVTTDVRKYWLFSTLMRSQRDFKDFKEFERNGQFKQDSSEPAEGLCCDRVSLTSYRSMGIFLQKKAWGGGVGGGEVAQNMLQNNLIKAPANNGKKNKRTKIPFVWLQFLVTFFHN